MARSAQSQNVKITTLSQEILRKMCNTSRKANMETRVKILNKFMYKLAVSGYKENERLEILKSGIKGYYSKVVKEIKGGPKINREIGKSRGNRKILKVVNKTMWFMDKDDTTEDVDVIEVTKVKHRGNKRKQIGDDYCETKISKVQQKTEAVVFIPFTPHS